ncbi:MAG: hypothetical protein KGJ35_03495 [Patescibacteria group bacterium]|nr:hypothetical protein [Patescibacteria group bacterium]
MKTKTRKVYFAFLKHLIMPASLAQDSGQSRPHERYQPQVPLVEGTISPFRDRQTTGR